MAEVFKFFPQLFGNNCVNTRKLVKDLGLSYETITEVGDLKPGDHICYPITPGVYHHAIVIRVIDAKTVEVIDLSLPDYLHLPIKRKYKDDISGHAAAGTLYRINYKKGGLPASEVIQRAESTTFDGKPGPQMKGYDLIFNNCEHFATWCKTGKAFSEQTCYMQE